MNRLDRIWRDRNHTEVPLVADFPDQATQRQNDEVLEGLEDSTLRELGQIEHALHHLQRGGGDRCECCGQAISSKRLTAVPYATACADCAQVVGPKAAAEQHPRP
jgi:DnaK suppressor protein